MRMDKELMDALKKFLTGEYSFDDLYESYYNPFMDGDDVHLSLVYSKVCLKMDYTTNSKLDLESRRYGWISVEEFKEWLMKILSNELEE